MASEDPKQSPPNAKNGENFESMFSPRFRSVAAMAGWDEEALLIASLVVEDTPERDFKQKKRSDLQLKTPPTNSRRKRRAHRKSTVLVSVPVLDLEEDKTTIEESEIKKVESKTNANEEKKKGEHEISLEETGVSSSSSNLPCMDRLREELSCAICLEICFEPSTTSCGHSFCKKCLRSAAEKCGKRCPKCRQLISNGRSCTVNTVLWNTIQLLFPQEVETRKASRAHNSREPEHQSPPPPPRRSHYNARNGSIQALNSPEAVQQIARRESHRDVSVRRRRRVPNQDEDAALALRLQREEFLVDVRGYDEPYSRSSLALARANLRAMASRAVNIRIRGRPM